MISIIVPSYNQQEYLADAIESALNQTVRCEVIVIDDGSTDHSLEIARKYPVKVISQVNKGLASARNTGIMNATNDWILPLDADDILLPTCVENIIRHIDKADIISPSFKTFGTTNSDVILMQNPTLEDFKTGNRVAYCSAIKKEKLLEIGGYSPKMVEGYEDLHLWINLLSRGSNIITIPKVLWLYRTKQDSMYTRTKPHHNKLLQIINTDFPNASLNF